MSLEDRLLLPGCPPINLEKWAEEANRPERITTEETGLPDPTSNLNLVGGDEAIFRDRCPYGDLSG
jgi:hypothetical protein